MERELSLGAIHDPIIAANCTDPSMVEREVPRKGIEPVTSAVRRRGNESESETCRSYLFDRFPRNGGLGEAVPADQAWFWTERWQQMEREADDAVAAGRTVTAEDVEEFVADLDP
jgi:hypothetical protein